MRQMAERLTRRFGMAAEMIVWGGQAGLDLGHYFNTGGQYDPSTDSWTATSTANAPDGRYRHTAVWTGNEMIVWGGILYSNTSTSTGGRYCAPGPAGAARQHQYARVCPDW